MNKEAVILFFFSFLMCAALFYSMGGLSVGNGKGYIWKSAAFSAANGLLMVLAWSLDSALSLPLVMFGGTAAVFWEAAAISRNTFKGRLKHYGITLLTMLCFLEIFHCVLLEIWRITDVFYPLILTMGTVSVLSVAGGYSACYVNEDLGEIFRAEKGDSLVSSYVALVILVQICSETVLLTQNCAPYRHMKGADLSLIMKDAALLAGSYLILIFQVRNFREERKNEEQDNLLKREQYVRERFYENGLANYCVNVTKDCFLEGGEYFCQDLKEDTKYSKLLRELVDECVFPDDKVLLARIGPQYYEERLEKNPSYNLCFRMDPQRFLAVTCLPEGARAVLKKAKTPWIWVNFYVVLCRDKKTSDIILYATMANVDEEVTKTERLRAAVETDLLTGLYNRRATEEKIQGFLEKGTGGTLFLVDLDHFKSVNDWLGHPAGDQLLKETAQTFRAVFRKEDVIGRIGGDEFAIFAVGLRDQACVIERAKSLNQACSRRHQIPDGSYIQTSLSIGIAAAPLDGEDYKTLYQNSDKALYEAKRAGRNRYCFYRKQGETSSPWSAS